MLGAASFSSEMAGFLVEKLTISECVRTWGLFDTQKNRVITSGVVLAP